MGFIKNPFGEFCTQTIKVRYLLAVLGSIGLGIVYGLKVNLSVAIVSMVNTSAMEPRMSSQVGVISSNPANISFKVEATDVCFETRDNNTVVEVGPFPWTGTVQGTLKSSYFWGYIVAQIPGGRLAEIASAKWVLFFAVAINVIGTVLSPIAAKIHYGVLVAIRISEGIGGGVTFPAMHVLLANWAPPAERSIMCGAVYSGTAFGTMIFTLISGLIASSFGWEAIFYIEGCLSAVWLFVWATYIKDTPHEQGLISDEERKFIISSLETTEGFCGKDKKRHGVPWSSVFTSLPFWAILIAHVCSNWGWYMVLIEMPNYMKNILKFRIAENAFLSSIPYLTMWLFAMFLSKYLDFLRSKDKISTTIARKVSTFIASVIPLVCFYALSYIGCMPTLAIILMTVSITACGGMFSGYLCNHIDIAPNYAGTLMAVTNTFATIPGILVPIFVGKLTEVDPSINSWRIIFWVTVMLYLLEIIVYSLFGSGKEQKWNKYDVAAHEEAQPLKSPITQK